MTISSRTTELSVPRVVAEVPAVVRARPARMVTVSYTHLEVYKRQVD